MTGKVIAQADIRRDGLRWPFPPRLKERLEGQRVDRLRRRSKYILGDLSGGETFILHLGMSGRVLISGQMAGAFHHPHGEIGKHDHVVLTMDDGVRVTLNDARRFGAFDLIATAQADAHPLLAKLGPEPLGNAFSAETLIAGFAGRRTPVKAALLDQRIVAGLGNIYVCEALWRSRISPKRAAGRISPARVEALTQAVRAVLAEAIDAGGSSLRDHRQTNGELGYFQHSFAVYDRESAPCARQGCGGEIRRIVQSGRSSFYCPACQR